MGIWDRQVDPLDVSIALHQGMIDKMGSGSPYAGGAYMPSQRTPPPFPIDADPNGQGDPVLDVTRYPQFRAFYGGYDPSSHTNLSAPVALFDSGANIDSSRPYSTSYINPNLARARHLDYQRNQGANPMMAAILKALTEQGVPTGGAGAQRPQVYNGPVPGNLCSGF